MVARQPIYTNRMGVFGYELLFRSAENTGAALKPTQATAQVLAATILNFGLDELVLHRKAIINVTRAFLDVMSEVQLPSGQIILDIPDNIVVTDSLVAKLKELRAMGYGVSVGGVENLRHVQRLLPYADIFRIDIHRVHTSRLEALTKFLRRYSHISLQALKIETMEQYRFYCDRGFDYLQGYFLSRPREYVSKDVAASKITLLRLLASVHGPDTTTLELEKQISHDVALSYKLIKLINAPFFGIARKVESIKQAIVLLGRDEIRKWVSLLALGSLTSQPVIMMETAMLRARMCELIADRAALPRDSYFTVGLFSALDMLMQQPIDSVLATMPLNDAVKAAILRHEGTMGRALACALAVESADWSAITFDDLGYDDLLAAHREAIQWTAAVTRAF